MLKLKWAFLSSKYLKPGFSRNPFEVLMEKEASWALDPSHVRQKSHHQVSKLPEKHKSVSCGSQKV